MFNSNSLFSNTHKQNACLKYSTPRMTTQTYKASGNVARFISSTQLTRVLEVFTPETTLSATFRRPRLHLGLSLNGSWRLCNGQARISNNSNNILNGIGNHDIQQSQGVDYCGHSQFMELCLPRL